jgi:hypothetical protein
MGVLYLHCFLLLLQAGCRSFVGNSYNLLSDSPQNISMALPYTADQVRARIWSAQNVIVNSSSITTASYHHCTESNHGRSYTSDFQLMTHVLSIICHGLSTLNNNFHAIFDLSPWEITSIQDNTQELRGQIIQHYLCNNKPISSPSE